jgi:hyperosmotically inducible periplasmic protein
MKQKALLLVAIVAGVVAAPSAFAQNDQSSSLAASASSSVSAPVSNRKAMKAADKSLARAVRKAVEHVKGLDATRIAIVAHNGNVTLTGSVPDASQVDLAVQHAKAVPGVTTVVNRLTVGELGP